MDEVEVKVVQTKVLQGGAARSLNILDKILTQLVGIITVDLFFFYFVFIMNRFKKPTSSSLTYVKDVPRLKKKSNSENAIRIKTALTAFANKKIFRRAFRK